MEKSMKFILSTSIVKIVRMMDIVWFGGIRALR